MSLVSVPAVFDGKQIRLLEQAPVHEPYRVLVTFVEPARKSPNSDNRKFENLKGIWRGIDLSFEDIQRAEYKGAKNLR
jgi:hypothetical protein